MDQKQAYLPHSSKEEPLSTKEKKKQKNLNTIFILCGIFYSLGMIIASIFLIYKLDYSFFVAIIAGGLAFFFFLLGSILFIVYLFKWVKNYPHAEKSPSRRKALREMYLPLVIDLPLVLALILGFNYYVSFTPEKFQTISEGYRYYVTKDFLSSHSITSFSKENIISSLGEPNDEMTTGSEYELTLRYYIGYPKEKFAIDPYLLDFNFSEASGTVTSYSLYES